MELALSQKLEGLISLLHTWRGAMLFPPGSSDEPKVDLCQCSTGGSDSYVFNRNKYCGDPKCHKEDMANISTRYMSLEERNELARFQSSHISTSVSANLISSLSDFRWLPSQVQYCSSKENEFLNQVCGTLSSADQLLAYLRSRDDVSFVVLTDTSDGLVVTSTKGKH